MIANITCLVEAARRLGVPYYFLDENHNFLKVNGHYFSNCSTPLNSEQVATICKDKQFTYDLAHDVVAMPVTQGYFDPQRKDYAAYIRFGSIEEIQRDILNSFTLPCILKRNSGFQARNVFICKNGTDVGLALKAIFDQSSKDYDYVALAQEYIVPARELRVIILNHKPIFVYDWSRNFEVIRETDQLFERICGFIDPLFSKLDLNWAGLDIILDASDKLHLIELNSKPGFENFIAARGQEEIVKVYTAVISFLTRS